MCRSDESKISSDDSILVSFFSKLIFNIFLIAWIEGFAIFTGVFIVASVGSWNDWTKEKQFMKLQAESEKDNIVS